MLQDLYVLLRDRFPMTAYMFPPHLLRTGNISRTLAQPRLKRKSTPEPLPNVALFPYRTTKSRHWVLYLWHPCRAGMGAKHSPSKCLCLMGGDTCMEARTTTRMQTRRNCKKQKELAALRGKENTINEAKNSKRKACRRQRSKEAAVRSSSERQQAASSST